MELCRSETEVRCRMQGMQEAQVMQVKVMQSQEKSQSRGSCEGGGGGGGHWEARSTSLRGQGKRLTDLISRLPLLSNPIPSLSCTFYYFPTASCSCFLHETSITTVVLFCLSCLVIVFMVQSGNFTPCQLQRECFNFVISPKKQAFQSGVMHSQES